jgi:PAS domain S-box-containing protein
MVDPTRQNPSAERRQQPHFTDLGELLDNLPARVLLDRMPGPVMGVDPDGAVAYANPAAVSLLGYTDGALIGRSLPSLVAGWSSNSGADCVARLRAAPGGETVDWMHADGFSVHTAVSTPLLLRASDPFLMVYITDVTELHWGS